MPEQGMAALLAAAAAGSPALGILAASRIDPSNFVGPHQTVVHPSAHWMNDMGHYMMQEHATKRGIDTRAKVQTPNDVDSSAVMPMNLPLNPRLWSREDVNKWLEWSELEFSLTSLDTSSFAMNGKALCLLDKQDFRDRVPAAGDVLYNTLQIIIKNAKNNKLENLRYGFDSNNNVESMLRQNLLNGKLHAEKRMASSIENMSTSPTPSSDSGNHSNANSPEYMTRGHAGSPQSEPSGANGSSRFTFRFGDDCSSDLEEHAMEDDMAVTTPRSEPCTPPAMMSPRIPMLNKPKAVPGQHAPDIPFSRDNLSSGRLLWDFLQQLLNDPEQRYRHCIIWRDREIRIFKITDPQALAKLWGIHKNHLNMNFDKMSRALRYYYRVNILRKEQGEKHCYRFLRHPAELRHCRQKSLLNLPVHEMSKSIRLPSNSSPYTKPDKSTIEEPLPASPRAQKPMQLEDSNICDNNQTQALNLRVKDEGSE